ncbi:MAG: prepilin-type N-terminal cleavage/methylation domain-containing protein [Patescibacteria group bacterium]|jgi:prepilin-type N-terminal cleavage/methylation domain-containing protein
MINRSNSKFGFTLIEVLVASAIFSIIVLVMASFLSTGLRIYQTTNSSTKLQDNLRKIVSEFERSTRAASQVVSAKRDELVFYRFYQTDQILEPLPTRVRYFTQTDKLVVGKSSPVSIDEFGVISFDAEEEALIIENLDDTINIFTYYDDSNQAISFDANGVVPAGDVKMVGLSMLLDKDKVKAPLPVSGETKVSLRNLKRNL